MYVYVTHGVSVYQKKKRGKKSLVKVLLAIIHRIKNKKKKRRIHARPPTFLTLLENKNAPATQIFPRGQRADCVSLLITPFPLGICIQSFKCQTNILNYARVCPPLAGASEKTHRTPALNVVNST